MGQETLSDHRYIQFSLNLTPQKLELNRFKTKFTKFHKFNKLFKHQTPELMESLAKITNKLDLDNWLNNFNTVILDICNKSLKVKNFNLYPKFDWWTASLKTQRNKISALRKKFRNTKDPKWRALLQRERAKYKKQIKIEKLNSWKKFCSNTKETFGQQFKIATNKRLKNHHFIHTSLQGSHPNITKQEIFQDLLNHHFPINNLGMPPLQDPASGEDLPLKPPIFSFKEINSAINEQNNLKAPGHDKIDAFIIKNINKTNKNLLKELFNKCLILNYFPKEWKIANVIFFSKQNKDPKLPSSYRPICLLPMLGKIYERLLKHRINYHLENNNYFHNSQFGFREGKSTIQLLSKIKSKITLKQIIIAH